MSSSKTFILDYQGILVHKDAYCYVVSNSKIAQAASQPPRDTQKIEPIGFHPTYHSTLLTALEEVSLRLLEMKFVQREKELRFDINSLKEVFINHAKEMRELYKLDKD